MDRFNLNELIECNFYDYRKNRTLIIFLLQNCKFRRNDLFMAHRTAPIFFNFKDNAFVFRYKEFDIEINNNTFESNLTAVLAYYAYIIIGMDLDSYSRLRRHKCLPNSRTNCYPIAKSVARR